MSTNIAAERRLLGNDFDIVAPSHYPALGELPADEVLALARRLREHRKQARDQVNASRRARRGKADPRGGALDEAVLKRKQVFASALKRVNARLETLHGEVRRAYHAAALRDVLARKREARAHHPGSDPSAAQGMRAKVSRKRTVRMDPREIGRVSQAVKTAQARRDG